MHRTDQNPQFRLGQRHQILLRWQGKNGTEDLAKAVWYVKDAILHGVPLTTNEWSKAEAVALLTALAAADWADLRDVWITMAKDTPQHVLTLLVRKIAEIENGRTKEES